MTTPPHDDPTIPPEIEARLRRVDDALPPTPAWRAPADGGPRLRVVPGRGRTRGPSAVAMLVAVMVLVGIVVVVPRAVPQPGTGSSPVGSALATVEGVSPSPAAAQVPAIRVIRNGVGIEALRDSTGGVACREPLVTDRLVITPDATQVDALAEATGTETGWLEVPGRTTTGQVLSSVSTWLGADVVALAADRGAWIVAAGGSVEMSLVGAGGLTQWQSLVTPAGRVAWWRTSSGSTSIQRPCPTLPPPDPSVLGVRSYRCEGVPAADCRTAIEAARSAEPGAFSPQSDVVVSAVRVRANAYCLAPEGCSPSDFAVHIVAIAPADWSVPEQVRVVRVREDGVVGSAGLGGPFVVQSSVLDLVALPALPLPTLVGSIEFDSSYYCPGRLDGVIRGSPWDPRVAWVGDTAVLWPSGYRARFVPTLELLDADGNLVAREGGTFSKRGSTTTKDGVERFAACPG